jgi:hypothetical protein
MVVLSDLRSSWKALELTLYCATAVLESAANNKVMNFIVDRRIGEAVCNGRFVLIVLGMMMKLDNEERNHRNRRKVFFICEASVHMAALVVRALWESLVVHGSFYSIGREGTTSSSFTRAEGVGGCADRTRLM